MNKKWILIIVATFVIVAVILGVLIIVKNRSNNENKSDNETEEKIEVNDLKAKFNELFNNEENEYVTLNYKIEEEKSGKYSIIANIPFVHISTKADKKINSEINDIFIKKLLQIYNNSTIYTKFNMDYAVKINDSILSLAIKCSIKEGPKTQRIIIKTYNFDIEKNEFVDILRIIPSNNIDKIQELIDQTIENESMRAKVITEQGYKAFNRDTESEIYYLENSNEFFINNNILYIIYSYGNNNNTGEVDLVVTEI